MSEQQPLSTAQRRGILQELRSDELSTDQELDLFNRLIVDERQRQGIVADDLPETQV